MPDYEGHASQDPPRYALRVRVRVRVRDKVRVRVRDKVRVRVRDEGDQQLG